MIRNPVLPGFHPDPSIIRVGLDYYLATSTFEWFPGVALHHSRDLENWTPIGHALTRTTQMNLTGVPDSGGIWAPSLSHADGKFWLVYTVMRTRTGPYKDMVNALVTADCITGPWSEPVYLNSRGFDPSLFHDDDGKIWMVQIRWDHRKDHPSFGGIFIQEYHPETRRLTGPATRIYGKETLIEGPNIYNLGGYYYLMLAEGGTSWNHAVSVVRSRSLHGPYEPDPREVVLTSRGRPELPLQKSGHGELVETASGEWYLAHLASRPLKTEHGPRCPLGRETCLQKVVWTSDGWLRLAQPGTDPALWVDHPMNHPRGEYPAGRNPEPFPPSGPGPEWQSLRRPVAPDWADFTTRPGWLRLRGGESPASLHDQSLLARRVTSVHFHAEVRLDFHPSGFQQMAGLVCYYDTKTHLYLRVTADDGGLRRLGIVTMLDGKYEEPWDTALPGTGDIVLAVDWDGASLQFSFSCGGGNPVPAGAPLDASVLSDDFGTGLHFTGAFIGLCAQDFDTRTATADFTDFIYAPASIRENPPKPLHHATHV